MESSEPRLVSCMGAAERRLLLNGGALLSRAAAEHCCYELLLSAAAKHCCWTKVHAHQQQSCDDACDGAQRTITKCSVQQVLCR